MRRWVGLLGVMLAIAACTGGGSFSTTATGGSSGVGGGSASGTTGAVPPPSTPPGDAYAPPIVACSFGDGGSDAGTDAETVDAESPQDEDDAGTAASPCDAPPPPDCVSSTAMVVFSPGPCDGVQCIFGTEIVECPGGCFRQMDGGKRCNE